MPGRVYKITLKNPVNGEESKYNLIFDFNALLEIESTLEKTIPEICSDSNKKIGKLLSAKDTLAILYAGLMCEYPDLKLADLGKMISVNTYIQTAQKVLGAFFDSFNEKSTYKEPEESEDGGAGDEQFGGEPQDNSSIGTESNELEQPLESNPGTSTDTPSGN